MSESSVKTSAPGSLMLFGEHAVLQKNHAISSAIDKRVFVQVKKRSDDIVKIQSSLGQIETSRHALTPCKPFTFVIQALLSQNITSGVELEITSEMSPLFGLGTSAAVTVATLKAVTALFDKPIDLLTQSIAVIRAVQSRGSGADVAASLHGGTVFYEMEPAQITSLPLDFDLTVVYSGSKMATPDVINIVLDAQKKRPELYEHLFTAMDKVTLEAKNERDLKALGELFNHYQGLLDTLGVNNAALSEIVYKLRMQPEILGSKISGSGLGDSAIGLGKAKNFQSSFPLLSLSLSKEGARFE